MVVWYAQHEDNIDIPVILDNQNVRILKTYQFG
jgi:hypothetical protein